MILTLCTLSPKVFIDSVFEFSSLIALVHYFIICSPSSFPASPCTTSLIGMLPDLLAFARRS